MNKKTIVISSMNALSPCIIGHADHMFKTVEDFENWLSSMGN